MAVIGGSLDSVNIAGRNFAVPADTDVEMTLAGYENDSQANGNGTARMIKTRKLASITGVVVEIDDIRDDHQFLEAFSTGTIYEPVTVTLVDGTVWEGEMQVNGELKRGTQNSTASFDLMGPSLRKQ